jgi:tetratricopeptide (TPR) repeat protein
MSAVGGFISAVVQVLGLTLTILVLAILIRIWFTLSRRVRSRGRVPIVVGSDVDSVENGEIEPVVNSLISMLRAYIAEDVQGTKVLVPGAPKIATPDIPAELPKSLDGWLRGLYVLAVTDAPAYRISIARLPSPNTIKATVQVIWKPRNAVLATATFESESLEELTFQIGGYCVEQVQQQRRVLLRTPRWEHWANRGGYSIFREGLKAERSGARAVALEKYESAGSLSLGNVTIALRRASILEQEKRHIEAIQVYYYCQMLWPESIECAYRYAAACSNLRDASLQAYGNSQHALDSIVRNLRVVSLVRRLLLTWMPNRKNLGEREYWLSWFRPWRSGQVGVMTRRSKRRDFLAAVCIAQNIVKLGGMIQDKTLSDSPPLDAGGEISDELFRSLTDCATAVGRQLDHRRIGWLAHYNGACFYSLCSNVHPQYFRSTADLTSWRTTQVGAALAELASVIRDPFNSLDPAWVLIDPDMQNMRAVSAVNHWAHFLGIDLGGALSQMGVKQYRGEDPLR